MKYRQNNNAMILYTEINAIRKTIGDNPTNILMNNGILKRVLGSKHYATVYFSYKLTSQAKSLAFVQLNAQPERGYNAVLYFSFPVPRPVSFTLGSRIF